jgi:hypothetical protein
MSFHYHTLPSYETPLHVHDDDDDEDISSVASDQLLLKPPHYSIAMSDAINVTTPNTNADNASNKDQSKEEELKDKIPVCVQLLFAILLIIGLTIVTFVITQAILEFSRIISSWLAVIVSSRR